MAILLVPEFCRLEGSWDEGLLREGDDGDPRGYILGFHFVILFNVNIIIILIWYGCGVPSQLPGWDLCRLPRQFALQGGRGRRNIGIYRGGCGIQEEGRVRVEVGEGCPC